MRVAQSLSNHENWQAKKQKVADAPHTRIAKPNQQTNKKKRRYPAPAKPGQITLNDLPQVCQKLEPVRKEGKVSKNRFESALQFVSWKKDCGFQHGITG